MLGFTTPDSMCLWIYSLTVEGLLSLSVFISGALPLSIAYIDIRLRGQTDELN